MKIIDIFMSKPKSLDDSFSNARCTYWRPEEEIQFLRKFELAALKKFKAKRMKRLCEAQKAQK